MQGRPNVEIPLSKSAAGASLMENTRSVNSPESGPLAGRRLPINCGDLDMRIARDGVWFYRGTPIGRLPLVKLFASVLCREADGSYWLVTPAARGRLAGGDV